MANNQIALLSRAFELESPIEAEGRALKLAELRAASQARQQAVEDDRIARSAFQANPNDPLARLSALAPSPKAYAAERKAQQDLAKDAAETDAKKATTKATELKTNIERMTAAGQALGYVVKNPTVPAALSVLDQLERDGIYTPEVVAQYRKEVQEKPETIADLANQAFTAVLAGKDQLAKLETRDLGGTLQNTSTDPITGKVTVNETRTKTQTPDNVATNARMSEEGRLNRAQSQQQFNTRENRERAAPRGTIIQTDEGPMLADPRAGTAVPVRGPDGQPLTAKAKPIPSVIQRARLDNRAALRKIDETLEAIEGRPARGNEPAVPGYPQGLGVMNYLGDGIRQRTDPEGVNVRALTADVGSLKIHDRSGAAVTASETPRLKPFIPLPTDAPDVAAKKLRLFKKEYEAMERDYDETYSRENGYRAETPRGGASADWGNGQKPSGAPPAKNANGWTLHTDAQGNKAYVSPDGKNFQEVK